MALYGATLCKRFTNKYVPVVIGLRANNVRPYGRIVQTE